MTQEQLEAPNVIREMLISLRVEHLVNNLAAQDKIKRALDALDLIEKGLVHEILHPGVPPDFRPLNKRKKKDEPPL